MQTRTLTEIIENYSHENYDFTKNGKCSGCGNCCSDLLPVTDKEIRDIKAYIKKHNIKKQEHRLFVLSNAQMDMTCPFLDDSRADHKCTIYEVRPFICKDFICTRNRVPNERLYQGNRKLVHMSEEFF